MLGLVDRSGREMVPPQFEFVKGHAHGEFFDGTALAFRDGKYGFVDQQGSIAVEPMFDLAGDFGEGLALVEINGAYGYIDRAGKPVIMPKFEDAGVFPKGLHRYASTENGAISIRKVR
ncbi:MAG: WG repeat-containing protein [Lewinellaceae bacterium]|nr:WG repeat-containing protein [Lewinellaceae bacterium]